MFSSLEKIHNPFYRSLTAAVTLGSVITFTGAVVIGITNPKNESAYQAGVYASLLGMGCGAVLGLVQTPKQNQPSDSITWKDWRDFMVVRKVKESEEITSFYLQPKDQDIIPNFLPGQFLTIKLDIPGQSKPIIRTYSLSDYNSPCNYYRLSIKREPAPKGLDVMPGIASSFMHDQVQVGSIIPAKLPSGKFVLDVEKSIPAVLISNGVGITPMISMAKAVTALNPNRSIWFLHGARDGTFHAFRDEIKAVAAENPNLHLHFAYSRPRPEDDTYYQSVGYIDTALIQGLIKQEAEYFLCGSPSFMDSIRDGLKRANIPENLVSFEMFTKASKTKTDSAVDEVSTDEEIEIVFNQSGKTAIWKADAESILDFAEANDLSPAYSCRQGICGTCECKILEGEVEYQQPPTYQVSKGSVLVCISKPKTSKVVLEL